MRAVERPHGIWLGIVLGAAITLTSVLLAQEWLFTGPVRSQFSVFVVGGVLGLAVAVILSRVVPRIGPYVGTPDRMAFVQLIIDTVDAAITVYDGKGNLISANKGAERFSGYSLAELKRPETWKHLVPPDEYDRVNDIVSSRRPEDFPAPNINHWISRGGHKRLFRWSNVALFDDRKRLSMVVCIGFDITDQHQLELDLRAAKNAAEAASRSKSQFLANMSHELRTPLNAIIGFSEVIKEQIFGKDLSRYAAYAADIHESGQLLLSIISDILDLSKLEAGKTKLEERIVSIDDVVASASRIVGERCTESGLALEYRSTADLPDVIADQRALKQILLNLLSNSIKFTPKGGRITITADRTSIGGLMIAVADNGIGIPAEMMNLIAQPFQQAGQSMNRKYGGSGLGLSISKRLIELHGGSLTISSREREGTTVTIVLPPERNCKNRAPQLPKTAIAV